MEDMSDKQSSEHIARTLATVIDERQGERTMVLDLRQHEQVAAFYIITTAANQPHLIALLDRIDETMRQEFDIRLHRKVNDPRESGGWVVMDYEDIIIHIMSEKQREFYELEKLWFDAPRIYEA